MAKMFPAATWLSAYRREWLRPDIIAGLTAAAVVIPKAMAYASIAGLPLEIGLYTALVPMVIYAVMGTSRVLSVSTTATIAILMAAELATVPPEARVAAAVTLALLTGVFLLAAGVLRLGSLANLISDPVLTGFKAGIGLVVIVGQVPKLFGVHFDKGPLFHNITSLVEHLSETHAPTLVLAVVVLGLLFALEHFTPRLPAPLFAVLIGIAASWFFGLSQFGVELVGSVPGGLPAPGVPGLSLVGTLWPGALGISLIAFIESVAAGRAFARHGDPRPDAGKELLALGLANVGGSFFGGMCASGGTSQTAVNSTAGARTQAAELVTAGVAAAVLLFLAPAVALMPQAVLAAVVVATTFGLISPREFRNIRKIRHMEFRWGLVAFAGVVFLGTLQGILVAVAVSVLALLWHAANPPLYVLGRKRGTDVFRPLCDKHSDDETFPGLLLVRTEGMMNFASAPHVGEQLKALLTGEKPRVLLFDLDAVPDMEYTALRSLSDLEEKLRENGIVLWLSALNPAVLEVVRRSPLFGILGRERMFLNVEQAVEAYQSSGIAESESAETQSGPRSIENE